MNAVDERTRPPLTPWGKAKFDAAKPLVGPRAVPGVENNPELRCEPDGPPKLLNLPNPFEIIQIPGRVLMFFELGHIWRQIWTDGRALPKDPDPTYLGYSVGKWEGDTFVVDTIGFNDRLWDDSYGNPRSDATHLTERYRRINHDTLELQIVIDDPKAYTNIWVSPPKLHKLEPAWRSRNGFASRTKTKFMMTRYESRRALRPNPINRGKVLMMRFAQYMAAFGCVLVFSSGAFGQSEKQTEAPNAHVSTSALSHDLSGVWMPYSLHMDGIDENLRPPLTPWGQADSTPQLP